MVYRLWVVKKTPASWFRHAAYAPHPHARRARERPKESNSSARASLAHHRPSQTPTPPPHPAPGPVPPSPRAETAVMQIKNKAPGFAVSPVGAVAEELLLARGPSCCDQARFFLPKEGHRCCCDQARFFLPVASPGAGLQSSSGTKIMAAAAARNTAHSSCLTRNNRHSSPTRRPHCTQNTHRHYRRNRYTPTSRSSDY